MNPLTHVVNICLIQDGKILLVLKRKVGWDDHWILPGGKQEPGEDDTRTLQRELGKELPGLTYTLGTRIIERHPTRSISGKEIAVSAYLALTDDPEPSTGPDDSIIEARWFTSEEILLEVEESDEEFHISDATYEILEMLGNDGHL